MGNKHRFIELTKKVPDGEVSLDPSSKKREAPGRKGHLPEVELKN